MIEDKLACRSLWEGELACSSRAYHNTAKPYFLICLVMLIKINFCKLCLINKTQTKFKVSWQSG